MGLKILQWNIRGYCNNYSNLQLLLSDTDADIVCLQETKCKQSHTPCTPKKYIGYFFNRYNSSKEGVAILIKKSIPHQIINSTSPLCCTSVQINLSIRFTILSLYLPPQETIHPSMLDSLITNILPPVLILGDLNAWSSLWGSPKSNNRGITVEAFIDNSNMTVLIDGSPTHLSTHDTFTHIDVAIVSITLFPKCS